MVDSDSDAEPKTSSVAGQEAEPALSQSVSQPAVAETLIVEPVSGALPSAACQSLDKGATADASASFTR